jgi:hypothetical protein
MKYKQLLQTAVQDEMERNGRGAAARQLVLVYQFSVYTCTYGAEVLTALNMTAELELK